MPMLRPVPVPDRCPEPDGEPIDFVRCRGCESTVPAELSPPAAGWHMWRHFVPGTRLRCEADPRNHEPADGPRP